MNQHQTRKKSTPYLTKICIETFNHKILHKPTNKKLKTLVMIH